MIDPMARQPGFICQLSSGHSVEDERILHRMARTAARYGYKSAFAVPQDGRHSDEQVMLVPCPLRATRRGGWRRWTAAIPVLWWAVRSDGELFQIHDPDLVPVGLLLKWSGRRVIYDVHDDYEASIRDRLGAWGVVGRMLASVWAAFEQAAARAFDGVVVVDRHLERKFARCEPVVLGNFPALDFTAPADAEQEETFNVIYVGGVTRERGLEVALKALQSLSIPSARLHIIGTGSDSALTAQLLAEPKVVMHGRVPWTELHRLYAKAHVGLALYQRLAGFVTVDHSVKIVEYMAAGIPVVCSDFPGLRAFVEDAQCGLVVQPESPEEVGARIQRLFEDTTLRRRLGANGRRLFEGEYHWEKQEHRLVEMYRRTLQT